MAINSINSTGSTAAQALASYLKSSAASSEDTSSLYSNLTDILDLGSSDELSDYLQYTSTGQYSGTALADYLGDGSEQTDLFSMDSSSEEDTSSFSSAFTSLADAKIQEIDTLIQQALERLSGKNI